MSKIICINNVSSDQVFPIVSSKKYALTIGKEYFLIREKTIKEILYYCIKNDKGGEYYYTSDNFITLADIRDKKLNDLLNG